MAESSRQSEAFLKPSPELTRSGSTGLAKSSRQNYKPFVLRTPVLGGLFLLTIALVVLVEYAERRLPHGHHALSGALGHHSKRQEGYMALDKRDNRYQDEADSDMDCYTWTSMSIPKTHCVPRAEAYLELRQLATTATPSRPQTSPPSAATTGTFDIGPGSYLTLPADNGAKPQSGPRAAATTPQALAAATPGTSDIGAGSYLTLPPDNEADSPSPTIASDIHRGSYATLPAGDAAEPDTSPEVSPAAALTGTFDIGPGSYATLPADEPPKHSPVVEPGTSDIAPGSYLTIPAGGDDPAIPANGKGKAPGAPKSFDYIDPGSYLTLPADNMADPTQPAQGAQKTPSPNSDAPKHGEDPKPNEPKHGDDPHPNEPEHGDDTNPNSPTNGHDPIQSVQGAAGFQENPAGTPAAHGGHEATRTGYLTTAQNGVVHTVYPTAADWDTSSSATAAHGRHGSPHVSPHRSGQPSASSSASDAASSDPSSIAASLLSGGKNRDGTRKSRKLFTRADYVVGSYLPTIIAVVFRILWSLVYSNVKLLEPFYQMANNPAGAPAKEVLQIDYMSSNIRPDPLQALFTGHWVMLIASGVYFLVGFMAPLASETLSVDTKGGCTGGTGRNPCPPRLVVNQTAAKGLKALLIFTAIMTLALIILQSRRRSGIPADPSNIATMATLLHHPQVVEDFRRVDPAASEDEMKKALASRRYRLGYYQTPNGMLRYGVVLVHDQPLYHAAVTGNSVEYMPVLNPTKSQTRRSLGSQGRSTRVLRIIRDIIFGLALIGALGVVVAYWQDHNYNDNFNNFMNSETFGPRFIMTLAGSMIDSQWKRLERESRVMQPYRRLAAGNARARETLLLSSTSGPLTTFPYSLYRRNFFLAYISAIALSSEFLVVALAGVPYMSAQIYVAYKMSVYASVGILAAMLVALVAVFWRRHGDPRLPRDPDTLAGVWSYLCRSRTLWRFEDLALVGERERNRKVRSWQRRYWFGKVWEDEGGESLVIEEEYDGHDHGGSVQQF